MCESETSYLLVRFSFHPCTCDFQHTPVQAADWTKPRVLYRGRRVSTFSCCNVASLHFTSILFSSSFLLVENKLQLHLLIISILLFMENPLVSPALHVLHNQVFSQNLHLATEQLFAARRLMVHSQSAGQSDHAVLGSATTY